jgi:endonuclease/exonuclease/phosphatase family metal-dependent hydrolase
MRTAIARCLLLSLALLAIAVSCAGRSAKPHSSELRLLSWNVLHCADESGRLNLEEKARYIQTQDPSLVFLQELDQGCARTQGVDQMAQLGAGSGLEARFAAFMPFQGGQYGLGMLSALPIESSRSIALPKGDEPRVALALEVAVLGARLLAVDVHFNWIGDDTARFAQAQALLAELAKSDLPCIVAGDFNDRPESRTLQAFYAAGFEHLESAGNSWNARAPSKDIDHILFRSGVGLELEPRGGEVVEETTLSDHRPVLGRLTLRRKR